MKRFRNNPSQTHLVLKAFLFHAHFSRLTSYFFYTHQVQKIKTMYYLTVVSIPTIFEKLTQNYRVSLVRNLHIRHCHTLERK